MLFARHFSLILKLENVFIFQAFIHFIISHTDSFFGFHLPEETRILNALILQHFICKNHAVMLRQMA